MRSCTETAIGGSMLGMAMPLVGFGGVLVVGQAEALGLSDAPVMLPFGVMIVFSAMLLAFAGTSLLWLQRQAAEAERLVLDIPRSRRREVPAAVVRRRVPTEAGLITTQLVAFAGAERRVRFVARA